MSKADKTKLLNANIEYYLIPFFENGLDAVIVQDVGVIRFLTERFPELPIHLSTQMTINTADAVKTVRCNRGFIKRCCQWSRATAYRERVRICENAGIRSGRRKRVS